MQALDAQQDRLSADVPMFTLACAMPVLRHFDVTFRVCSGAIQHAFAKRQYYAFAWLETPRVTRDSTTFAPSPEVWVTDLTSFGLGIKSYVLLGKAMDMRPAATEATYELLTDEVQAGKLRFAKGTTPWPVLKRVVESGVEAWVDAHAKGGDAKFLAHVRKLYAGKFGAD